MGILLITERVRNQQVIGSEIDNHKHVRNIIIKYIIYRNIILI